MSSTPSVFIAATSDPVLAINTSGTLIAMNRPAHDLLLSAHGDPLRIYRGGTELDAGLLAGRPRQPFEVELRQNGIPMRHVQCTLLSETAADQNSYDEQPIDADCALILLNNRRAKDSIVLPEMNPQPVLRANLDGKVTYGNPASRFLLHLFGVAPFQLLPEPILTAAQEALRTEQQGEIDVSKDDFHYALTIAPLPRHDCVNIYGTDITQRVHAERELRRRVSEDNLTGLYSHGMLLEQLARARQTHDPQHKVFSVLYIDLDRFSHINDTFGHAVGDQLLIQVAERLRACVRENDKVARVSGDQFCILQEYLRNISELVETSEAILNSFQEPFSIDIHRIELTCSLGISLNTKPQSTTADLIHEADMSMRRARVAGRGRMAVFDESLMEKVVRSVSLEQQLRIALRSDQLSMHYQPKVGVANGELVGFEALIRWQHPEEGMISPVEFIPLAEDTGIIVPVGDVALEAVCADARRWMNQGISVPPIAVNCSALQLLRPDFAVSLKRRLEHHQIEPQQLQIEITESSLIEEIDIVISRLQEVAAYGIKIALDDFGTGFSSLQYLKKLPINYLKIDRSFIKDMLDDQDDRTITSTIVAMARELNLTVIAEGVEDTRQVDFLKSIGCEQVQGFFYSKPIHSAEVAAYIQDHS